MALPKNTNPLLDLLEGGGQEPPNPEVTSPEAPKGDKPPIEKNNRKPRETKKSKDTGQTPPKPTPETIAPETSPPTTEIPEEEAKVPQVIDTKRYEKYTAKRKELRPLRGIYFDLDVDEVLEALKAKRIEISKFVSDAVRQVLEDDGLLQKKGE